MKNTRIARLRQSKRVKQATKLLTVGLLVCPLAIGTIKALADEAETTLPTEQAAETPATIEEVAPVEETEITEPVQPEVVEESQPVVEQTAEPVQPTRDLQTSDTQEIAPQRNPVNAWYETEGRTTVTSGDTANYKFYFCTAYDDGSQSREEQTLAEIGVSLISSDPSDVISGSTITFGSSGTRTIQPNLGDTGKLEVTVVNGSFTVSYNTRGNGSLSSYPTASKGDGVWVGLDEMPTPIAGSDSHFKGWEVNGLLNGDWGVSNTIFSGFSVTEDTVVTAVFEAGELDWSRYDNALNQYLGYINLKSAYDEFGFTEEYDNCVSLYNYYVDFKAEKKNDPYFSQEELDRLAGPIGMGGIHLNLVDRHFFFDDNITPQITDYFNSLKTVYEDSTTYTPESKQAFNEAWKSLQEALNVETGWTHEIDGGKYTAYQALKTAESGLVVAETGESFTVGELDRVKAKEVLAQYNSLVESDYTPESWAKMKEMLAPKDSAGIVGSLEIICDFPDDHTLTDSNKESVQQNIYMCTDTITEAMKVLVKVGSGETPLQQSIAKLKRTITSAETKLAESGYTAESMKALRQALQNAKDVLANANSTQAEIDEAQKALDLAIASLVKEDNSNGGNTGNNGSNGTGNSTNDPNASNNSANNTNSQTTSNNQNSNTATNKPTGNNINKDGLPQTGEQSTTNAVIAGLSLTMLSILAWLKRKKV